MATRSPLQAKALGIGLALTAAASVAGCSRVDKLSEFASRLRDQVAGRAEADLEARRTAPVIPEYGGGGGRPRTPPPGARPAGQGAADQSGKPQGGPTDAPAPPPPSAPTVFYYPTTPTQAPAQ